MASNTVLDNFYIAGANTAELYTQINSLLSAGRFGLRKWMSSSSELKSLIPKEFRETSEAHPFDEVGDPTFVRTLGLLWCPGKDVLL